MPMYRTRVSAGAAPHTTNAPEPSGGRVTDGAASTARSTSPKPPATLCASSVLSNHCPGVALWACGAALARTTVLNAPSAPAAAWTFAIGLLANNPVQSRNVKIAPNGVGLVPVTEYRAPAPAHPKARCDLPAC